MPDGYYIHNPSRSRTILKLTADTQYRFIDWGRSFSDSDEPEMPFFIEVENGAVTLIEENRSPDAYRFLPQRTSHKKGSGANAGFHTDGGQR